MTKGIHYIPILDAGIARRPWGNYSAYTEGSEKNVFYKINNGSELIA